MHCSACSQIIVGTALVFGPLVLCPQGCIPNPQPDISAQVERFAIAEAKKTAFSRRH
jgi:hypothetical protein